MVGSSGTTSTAGADSFVGAYLADAATGTTLNAGDNLNGGAGTDTFTISVSGASTAAQAITSVTLNNVERVLVSNFDSNANDAHDTDLNAALWTNATTLGLSASSATGDTTFSNVVAIVNAEMASGAGDLGITYQANAVAGAADSQALAVNGTTAGSFTADAGIESIAVTASGSNAVITDIVAGTNTIAMTIAASVNLTVSNELEAFRTINASASTGNVSVVVDDTTDRDLVITMGSGNDTVDIGSRLTSADTLVGGAGTTDTLIVDDSSDITDLAATNGVSGFEVIRFTQNSTAENTSFTNIAGYTAIDYRERTNSTNVAEGTAATISADIGGTIDHGVRNATNTGTTNAVTVTIDHGTANTDVDVTTLTVAGIETVNIVSQGVTSTNTLADRLAGTDTTGTMNNIATLTAAAMTTLNISGSAELELADAGGTMTALTAVNAGTMTGSLIFTNRSTATAATTITGGSAEDRINGRNGLDNISGGAGNDSIVGGGSNDILAGGDGADTITGAAGNDTITGGAGNDVIDSSTGSDNVSAGDGDDTIVLAAAFATDLTSADTVAGGDGIDTLRIDETQAVDLVTNAANLANVTGIEIIGLNDDAANTLTINDLTLGINNGTSITARALSNQAHVVNASGVLNSGATVNLTAATGVTATLTYTLSNAKDNLVFGAADAEVLATTAGYLSANDTIVGGSTTGDRILFSIDSATTINTTATTHALLNVSGVETITIDRTDGTAAADYVITLGDTFVAANYDAATGQFAITSGAGDTGDTDVDGSAVTAAYNLVLTGGTAADTLIGGAGNDQLNGGAGADTLTGGLGDDEIAGETGADSLTGGTGSDDFHVANETTMDVIADFNWGATTGTTTVDQIQFNATYLGGANGADNAATFNTAAIANNGTSVLVTVTTGTTGITVTTDVAVFTGATYTNAAALDTAVEALDSAVVLRDFIAVYQDVFGNTRIAVVESDGSADSGADFTVTDIAQLTGTTIGSIASLIGTGDFIFA